MNLRSFHYLIIVGIACLLLVGSSVSADGTPRAKRRNPVMHFRSDLKLSPGQEVAVARTKLRIKFTAVENDSRCPSDVNCVWAGNAAVKLELSGLGKGKSVTLNTSKAGQFVSETIYQGYKVKLLDLSPYPRSTQKISPGDYQATLLVIKG
jgi:hypothetical protein